MFALFREQLGRRYSAAFTKASSYRKREPCHAGAWLRVPLARMHSRLTFTINHLNWFSSVDARKCETYVKAQALFGLGCRYLKRSVAGKRCAINEWFRQACTYKIMSIYLINNCLQWIERTLHTLSSSLFCAGRRWVSPTRIVPNWWPARTPGRWSIWKRCLPHWKVVGKIIALNKRNDCHENDYALTEKSVTRADIGTKINPNQKLGEEKSICDMPAMLAAIGILGQKWLKINEQLVNRVLQRHWGIAYL